MNNLTNRKSLKQTLIDRDNLTPNEADEEIMLAQDQMNEYLFEGDLNRAYNICQEYFGLEPDYLDDIIPY